MFIPPVTETTQTEVVPHVSSDGETVSVAFVTTLTNGCHRVLTMTRHEALAFALQLTTAASNAT